MRKWFHILFLGILCLMPLCVKAQEAIVDEFGLEQRDSVNGSYKRFYPNGQLHVDATFVNGKLHGEVYTYTDFGALRLKAAFQKGKSVGFSVAYAYYPGTTQLYQKLEGDLLVVANDNRQSMTIYAAVNRTNGRCVVTTYKQDGQVETVAKVNYVNNHGTYYIYTPDGSLIETKEVYIDKKNGTQVFYIYSPEGVLIEEIHRIFRNGRKIKEWSVKHAESIDG